MKILLMMLGNLLRLAAMAPLALVALVTDLIGGGAKLIGNSTYSAASVLDRVVPDWQRLRKSDYIEAIWMVGFVALAALSLGNMFAAMRSGHTSWMIHDLCIAMIDAAIATIQYDTLDAAEE